MATQSVVELIRQLCEGHLDSQQRAYQVQPTVSRADALKRLERKAFNALFSYLENKPRKDETDSYVLNPEKEGVLQEIDRLRSVNMYKDAERLEKLLDKLSDLTYSSYVRFLVALKGHGSSKKRLHLGEGVFGSVASMISKTSHPARTGNKYTTLRGNESYRCSPLIANNEDVDLSQRSSGYYTHYPRDIFENLFTSIEMAHEKDLSSVLIMSPGKGIGPGGFFTQQFLMDDEHEQRSHSSLFGGLVQGKVEDLSSCFDLPDISQCPSFRIPDFKAKKSISTSQLSEESGVGSGSASMSSSVMTLSGQPDPDPWFWVNALSAPRSQHYTWEWIGYAPEATEKPCLTEAGPALFDLLVRHRRKVLTIMWPSPALALPVLVTVQPQVLAKDVLLMLTGVPSPNFLYNPVSMSFEVLDGLHVSGVSPEMLHDFLSEFTTCGTFFTRLIKFSQAPVLNSFYTSGLVFQAFTVAVRKALTQFTAAVLNIPATLGLLQLETYLHHAMEQLKYLAELCYCHDGPPKPPSSGRGDGADKESQSFPTGMRLLTYLYKKADVAVNSSHYPLLLSILQTTCAPFVLFIRDWVFHGVLRDCYEEFMIMVDVSVHSNRDESYWNSAYNLDTQAQVPHFLQGIVEDIVTCGKSINLLRLCSSQHFLCNVVEQEVPSVSISYSKDFLKAMEHACQMYLGRMTQVSRQLIVDRAEMMRKAEVARAELQQTARRMADQEISRLQGIIDDRKKKDEDKKRLEFARLKQQMEDDLKRRAGEKVAEKEEDAKLMAKITREEDALTEEEIELERRAREELVQYYTSLGEEAAHREKLALWKVQRARLSLIREDFLERDAQRWGQELREPQKSGRPSGVGEAIQYEKMLDNLLNHEDTSKRSPEDLDHLDSTGEVELPRWVQRHGGGDGAPPVEISDHEEVTLPAWAAQELPPTVEENEEEDGETVESGVQLPSWVLREAEDAGGDSPRVVKDDSGSEADSDSGEDALKREKGVGVVDAEESKGVESSSPSQSCDPGKGNECQSKILEDFAKDSVLPDSYKTEPTDPSKSLGRQLRAVQIGGSPLPKPHVKMNTAAHSSHETEELGFRPSMQRVEGKHSTDESSDPLQTKPNIRMVAGSSIGEQTEEAEVRSHVKASQAMSATKESEPEELVPRLNVKFVEGCEVNQQTTQEREVIPRKGKVEGQINVSAQSVPQVWVIKKPSMFGHASELSGSEYVLTVPKLKRQALQFANQESEYKDYGMRPRIRMNKNMSATRESIEAETGQGSSSRTHIRMIQGQSSSRESQRVDENEVARHRFLARNRRGHASDSTIQRLLYGDTQSSRLSMPAVVEDTTDGPVPKTELTPGLSYEANPYQSLFESLDQKPCVDPMSSVMKADLGRDLVDSALSSEEDVDAFKYTPLSVLLARCVTAPIKAQISLVNSAVVNYFTTELRIDDHFVAIRRYLLMADGDFSEILANILFEKLSTNPLPHEIFNPVFLNGALTKAVRSSIYSDDEHLRNLSFALRQMPAVLMPNAPNSLSCLELCYTVRWPLNVILTASCMKKYCRIFSFLLQIKRVVWTLKDVWHRLKRDALLVRKAATSPQFRNLQLHRQEMEHFVKAMQGYITSQVIHVSWQELQTDLAQPAAGLAQLQAKHQSYVNKALAKCLLDKKAAKVMKVIQDIFSLILKFRTQLVSATWQRAESGEVTHPNFNAILQTHKSFHVYSFFLFKVVNRLSQKGYQPHLQELLLQLNFNDFYKDAAT